MQPVKFSSVSVLIVVIFASVSVTEDEDVAQNLEVA